MSQFISLTQYQLIEAHGADAEKYLQGQLTTDVVQLASGATTLTAHCDPKGKMNAIYRLFKVSSEQFFFLIKKDLLPSGLDALKKYAVFSKVSFDLRDWQIIGLIGEKCGKITPHFSASCNVRFTSALLFCGKRLSCSGQMTRIAKPCAPSSSAKYKGISRPIICPLYRH